MENDSDGIMSDDSIYKTVVSDTDEPVSGRGSVLTDNGSTHTTSHIASSSVINDNGSEVLTPANSKTAGQNPSWVDPKEDKKERRLKQKKRKKELKALLEPLGKWLPSKPKESRNPNQHTKHIIIKPAARMNVASGSTDTSSPTVKRGRTSESTPPADPKKPKTMAQTVVDNNLIMIIYNDRREGGLVIESESEIIITEIMKERTICLRAGFAPKFGGFKTSGNVLQLTCADVISKQWLIELIGKISHKWTTMDLRCLNKTQLPKQTKAIVFIPYAPGFPSKNNDILVELKLSNSGLKTDLWRVINSNVTNPKGITLVVGIDKESLEVLKLQNFKAYFALVLVHFILQEKAEKVSEETTLI